MTSQKLIAIGLLFGFTGVAEAGDVWWINSHWEGLSGYSGSFLTCDIGEDFSLDDEDDEFALTGLSIVEVNNKGKALNLFGREMGIGDSDNPLVATDTIGGAIIVGSVNEVQLGTNRYIRAIRVCNNNNNDHKLKGVEIKSAYITSTDYVSESVTDIYEQPNCDTWDSWVTCPEGEVAVGVRMNYETDWFVGMELKCAEVVWSQ